jgi:hypothetical protein
MTTLPRSITITSTFVVALLGATLMNGYALARPMEELADDQAGGAQLKVGTVVLYDNVFSGASETLTTAGYVPGKRHSLAGKPLQDRTTTIAFNLPVGTAMTLTDGSVPQGPNGVADLVNAGKAIDLVGSGTTQKVDMRDFNMNDCISSFFWRDVYLEMGAIELYEDTNFRGNRTILFLSEWPMGKVASLKGWYIDDRLSSAKWDTLQDTQSAELWENVGQGNAYANISGNGSGDRCLKDFKTVAFNDRASSFSWQALVPEYEEIQPIKMKVSPVTGETTVFTASGNNNFDVPQSTTVKSAEALSNTFTVSTSQANAAGTKLGLKEIITGKLGPLQETSEISFELSYNYTSTKTEGTAKTVTTTTEVSHTFNVPAKCKWEGQFTVTMGHVPPTPFKTQAKRWYTQQLKNTSLDSTRRGAGGANLFWRNEDVIGTLEGRMVANVNSDVRKVASL